jgi:hypothetical protein
LGITIFFSFPQNITQYTFSIFPKHITPSSFFHSFFLVHFFFLTHSFLHFSFLSPFQNIKQKCRSQSFFSIGTFRRGGSHHTWLPSFGLWYCAVWVLERVAFIKEWFSNLFFFFFGEILSLLFFFSFV